MRTSLLISLGLLALALPMIAQPISTNISFSPSFPTTQDLIIARISGVWSNGCIPLNPVPSVFGNVITIATSNPGMVCTAALTPWGPYNVLLGRLAAGVYIVRVTYSGPSFNGLVGQTTLIVRDVPPPPPPAAVVCDPGTALTGQFLRDGARYYATGGPDPNPDFRGADRWNDLRTVDPTFLAKWQAWGKVEAPFETALFHNGDWVIYRMATRGAVLEALDLCLQATGSAPAQVEVFVQQQPPDPTSTPTHDGEIRNQAGWVKVGTLSVQLGSYQIYRVNVTGVAPSQFYNVALRLIEEGSADLNVLIAWLKLMA